MRSTHEEYMAFLHGLSAENLDQLDRFVAVDVRFADPFNDVRGADNMKRVFQHMFDNIGNVDFRIDRSISEDDVCMMHWQFKAKLRNTPWSFKGMSVVRFDYNGKVVEHIDYWDASRDFFGHLPVIGWLLAKIRNQLSVR